MAKSRLRSLGIAGTIGVALMLAGAIAYACTNLATLNTDTAAVAQGDTVAITGSSFGPSGEVVLHWNGVDGPSLATVPTDAAGNLSASVTIPEAAAGYYTIVATQVNAEGATQFGTPARAAVQVVAPGGELAVATADPGQLVELTPGSDGASVGLIALTAVLGIAGLALFGAGVAGFVRQSRSHVPARVRTD